MNEIILNSLSLVIWSEPRNPRFNLKVFHKNKAHWSIQHFIVGFQLTNGRSGPIDIVLNEATMNQLCTSDELSSLEPVEKDYCLKVDYYRDQSTSPYLGITTTGNPATDNAPTDSFSGQYARTIQLKCDSNTVS